MMNTTTQVPAKPRKPTQKKTPENNKETAQAAKTPQQKVEAARITSAILGQHSAWIPKEAEFIRKETKIRAILNEETLECVFSEMIETEDRTKYERLVEILAPLNIPKNKQDLFLGAAQHAVEMFFAERAKSLAGDKRNPAIEKLDALACAAREFSKEWRGLGHNLQLSLTRHMEGRSIAAKTKPSSKEILELHERSARIKQVAVNDLRFLIAATSELIEALKQDRSHDPAGYAFALAIGKMWKDCTGAAPTATRNDSVTSSGKQRTPFQRFVDAALAPQAIGDGVIRQAIEVLRVGDKTK